MREPVSALNVFYQSQAPWLAFLLLVSIGFGIFRLLKIRRDLALAFSLSGCGSFVFAFVSVSPQYYYLTEATVERFLAPIVLLGGFSFAVAADFFLRKITGVTRRVIEVAVVAIPLVALPVALPAANFRGATLVQEYLDTLASEVPRDALYVGGTGFEYFCGISGKTGLRFPMLFGNFTSYDWYIERAIPFIEPRLGKTVPYFVQEPWNIAEISGIQCVAATTLLPIMNPERTEVRHHGLVRVLCSCGEKCPVSVKPIMSPYVQRLKNNAQKSYEKGLLNFIESQGF
jgi:hypothetical protein